MLTKASKPKANRHNDHFYGLTSATKAETTCYNESAERHVRHDYITTPP